MYCIGANIAIAEFQQGDAFHVQAGQAFDAEQFASYYGVSAGEIVEQDITAVHYAVAHLQDGEALELSLV